MVPKRKRIETITMLEYLQKKGLIRSGEARTGQKSGRSKRKGGEIQWGVD